MRIVYGPVASWRLGRSLGVDPVAARRKQCPFSCVYCQYGDTASRTLRRQEYVAASDLRAALEALPDTEADGVTFAGLGEPTLAANLPALVEVVRRSTSLPVALLTGGALLPDPRVRADLVSFDQVIVTLNASTERLFQQINRPAARYPYSLAAIVDGLCRLRSALTGRLVIQVMLIRGNVHAAAAMAELVTHIGPDAVLLNTPLRPAIGGPIGAEAMRAAAASFQGVPVRTVFDGPRAIEAG